MNGRTQKYCLRIYGILPHIQYSVIPLTCFFASLDHSCNWREITFGYWLQVKVVTGSSRLVTHKVCLLEGRREQMQVLGKNTEKLTVTLKKPHNPKIKILYFKDLTKF